jgi:hypothetical protein
METAILMLALVQVSSRSEVIEIQRTDLFLATFNEGSGPGPLTGRGPTSIGTIGQWDATDGADITFDENLKLTDNASGFIETQIGAFDVADDFYLQFGVNLGGLDGGVGFSLFGPSFLSARVYMDAELGKPFLRVNGRNYGQMIHAVGSWATPIFHIIGETVHIYDDWVHELTKMGTATIQNPYLFEQLFVSGSNNSADSASNGTLDHIWGYQFSRVCVAECDPEPPMPEPSSGFLLGLGLGYLIICRKTFHRGLTSA